MSRKVLSEKPVTLEKVRDLLKQRESSHELNYIQRVTLEYALKFSKHFPHSEEMLDILGEQYNISREDGIQLINSNPERIEEIKLIIGDQLSDEIKQEILQLFKENKERYSDSDTDEDLPTDIESSTL